MSHAENSNKTQDDLTTMDRLAYPLYGSTFIESVKRFFQKYGTFDGRASRSEYWWVMLLNVSVSLCCISLMVAGGAPVFNPKLTYMPDSATPGLLMLLAYVLVTLIPNLALGMRRFHDSNFSGGFYFLYMVPYVGWTAVLVLALFPSNPEGVRFDRK